MSGVSLKFGTVDRLGSGVQERYWGKIEEMSDLMTAGAIALNLAGSFMPGTLPPEPPGEHQKAHAAWASIPHHRQIKPHLEPREGVFHAPAKGLVVSGESGNENTTTLGTQNWSGSGIVGAGNQYISGAVAMSVLVPNLFSAFGACDNNDKEVYTSVWTGIDGLGTSTVEQAGLDMRAVSNCIENSGVAPFIETYPRPENIVTNFPISPGDMIDVWTWISTTLTCGAWENESKQTYTSACITDPEPITASTIEWIVERPQLGSSLTTLGNYVALPMWSAWAWDYQKGGTFASATLPPQNFGSTGTAYAIDMTDDQGNLISHPYPVGNSQLLFYDVGSAYCQSAANCEPRY